MTRFRESLRAVDEEFRNASGPHENEPEPSSALGFINAMGNVKGFLLSICAAVTLQSCWYPATPCDVGPRTGARGGILKTLGFTREAIWG